MIIYPAIDIFEGKAVRLYKGDYSQMTVYNDRPLSVAKDFESALATHLHIVDLEGAKSGSTPNFETVCELKRNTSLFCEVGGGIRSMETVDKYISAGIDRVILGTAAVKNPEFAEAATTKYGDKIAIGVDIKDGVVAISGWTEKSSLDAFRFCSDMQNIGIKTIICTDISKDGAMKGTNVELYRRLSEKLSINIIASGGVSSIEDVKNLRGLDLHGAIIGKAYYTGAVDLRQAVEEAK